MLTASIIMHFSPGVAALAPGTPMTDHIKGSITDLKIMTDRKTVTVVLKIHGELQVFANSSHADSLLTYLADHGIVSSAKAEDPVMISTFHGSGSGTAKEHILVYEFTAASTMNSARCFDGWSSAGPETSGTVN